MTRSLTKAQITRRTALLDRLRHVETATPAELRAHLARYHSIYVTVDTVGVDLRAMEGIGTVRHTGTQRAPGRKWEGVLGTVPCLYPCDADCDDADNTCFGYVEEAGETENGDWLHGCAKHRGYKEIG